MIGGPAVARQEEPARLPEYNCRHHEKCPGGHAIADYYDYRIYKVGTNGIITPVAGNGTPGYSGDGGMATNAELNGVYGVTVDAAGEVILSDSGNNRVRKVDNHGFISTIAGNGTQGYSGDGGAATNAEFNVPCGVFVDALDNLLIADASNGRIRKITGQAPLLTLIADANTAGNYDLTAASPFGSVTSRVVSLTALFPPSFTGPPLRQAAGAGSDFSMSASAVGTMPLAYQWFFDSAELAGQTNSFLILTNALLSASGDYTVVVTNLYGSATNTTLLTVGLAPSLATQPADQAALAGGNPAFAIEVSGSGPFNFQWRFNGTNLAAVINRVAGNYSAGYSGDGGSAVNAEMNGPLGVAVDGLGNLYVTDFINQRVRMVDTNGIITTVAGNGKGGYSGDGAAATNAELSGPSGVAVDAFGSLFIADRFNHRIRKVGTNGIISTVAGNGTAGYSGDGGAATNAELNGPSAVAVDIDGQLFIADFNNAIRRVGTDSQITTVAGNGTAGFSGDGGTATNAQLSMGAPSGVATPWGVAADNLGNLFIADSNNQRIRKVGTDGLIETVAGNGTAGLAGDGGAATNAELNSPSGVAVDGFGDVYIADFAESRVRKVDQSGIITTAVGVVLRRALGDGGAATNASLDYPAGLAVDGFGNLFIADSYADVVREVSDNGFLLALHSVGATNAGNYDVVITSPFGSVTSGIAALTVLLPPKITAQPTNQAVVLGAGATITVSTDGTAPLDYQWFFGSAPLAGQTNESLSLTNLVLADSGGYAVVVTNLYGSVTSVVASLAVGFAPSIVTQPTNQTVPAGSNPAFLVGPSGTGPFFFQWQFNGSNLPNNMVTMAGGGKQSPDDGGAATNASLAGPNNVAVDNAGNVFIADTNDQRVRKVDANGVITTVAGNGLQGYSGDGGPATNADLNFPSGVAVDGSGKLFIADSSNNLVRKVDPDGIIRTVAGDLTLSGNTGQPVGSYSGDGGPATNAGMSFPTGVAVDGSGNLFIADNSNNRIRKAALADSPLLTVENVARGSAGNYQVIVTSPYGSVTSAVVTLTVVVPPTIVMNLPANSGPNLLLGFTLSQGTNTSFTLLQTPSLTDPWTTNTAAVLTSNSQTGGFQFSIPAPGSVEFYQVRSP